VDIGQILSVFCVIIMVMLITEYFIWHYSIAPPAIWVIFGNYAKATWHRFLIGRHFKTLLAPWHRRQPSDMGERNGIGSKMLDAISDFYIRILAAFIRLTLIILGLIFIALVFVIFASLFFIWILWPLIAGYFVIKGIALVL